MPTPPSQLRDDPVTLITDDVRDTEVDLKSNRLCWTGGGNRNPLMVARVDDRGQVVDQRLVTRDIGSNTEVSFPNGAEWGLLESGATGIYFSRRYDPDPDPALATAARVYAFDPGNPRAAGFEALPKLIIDQSADGYDCWLNDAWESLSPPKPLISFARVQADIPPLEAGELMVFDPTGHWLETTIKRIPNYETYLDNTTNRAIGVVPEFPSMVFTRYEWSTGTEPGGETPPEKWQFIWQHLNEAKPEQFAGGRSFFELGQVYEAQTNKVIGVGVQKLTAKNEHGFGFKKHGYCLYVLRREADAGPKAIDRQEFIDFYIFDYDDAHPDQSQQILFHSEPVPPVTIGTNPDDGAPLIFRGIGYDESYVDPDGNPCIALAMVKEIDNDPSIRAGSLVAVTLDYLGHRGGTPGVRFDSLSIPHQVVRKDPEVVPMTDPGGRDWVLIFNRARTPGPERAAWSLRRTLVWD